jgi:hypothetical protein
MSNVESAAAAGDNFNLRSVLLADGAGAVIGSAFGSPFPPAVYIGHPGWKDAGARSERSRRGGRVRCRSGPLTDCGLDERNLGIGARVRRHVFRP